jgi:hypothetical protein
MFTMLASIVARKMPTATAAMTYHLWTGSVPLCGFKPHDLQKTTS